MVVESENMRVQLLEQVDTMRQRYPSESFERYWGFYKASTDIQDVKAFLIKTIPETKYIDVAVIGDGLVVDVDGCEDGSESGLAFFSLKTLRSVHFHTEAIASLPFTEGSSLVVTTRYSGPAAPTPYWMAATPEEEENLLGFANVLARLVGST